MLGTAARPLTLGVHWFLGREVRTIPTSDRPILKGHAAPDFTLATPEGEFLSLQELRGRKILLIFLRHFA